MPAARTIRRSRAVANTPAWIPLAWEGKDYEFLCHIHPSDPSVGVTGPFVEGIAQVKEGTEVVVFSDEKLEAFMDYDQPEGKALQEALENLYYRDDYA